MSYALCLERLHAGTASIEYVEGEIVDGEKLYTVRIQFSGVGHVLTGITQQQLDDLRAVRLAVLKRRGEEPDHG